MPPTLDDILSNLASPRPADDFEGDRLEFKEVGSTVRQTMQGLADAAVCFANARGGDIVVGVNDKATTRAEALRGADTSTYSIDAVRRAIFDRTRPALLVDVDERIVDGARLIIIRVPQGIVTYSNTAGTATRRVGKECRPFPPEEQRELRIARGELDWSAASSRVPFDALGEPAMEQLRAALAAAGEEELARLTGRRLLDALHLVAADGFATNAALALMAPAPILMREVPTYGYSYQYRPSMGREATSRLRQSRPILDAVDILLDAVEARLVAQPLNVRGGVQLQLVDYPLNAVRELVVNGLIHRNYDLRGTVDIEHSGDSMVVSSPGGLVLGVTPENILVHPSTPRNRLLAEAVSRLHLAERTGQGVDRAYREMLRSGKEPPRFFDDGLLVRAMMTGGIGNDAFTRFIADLPANLAMDVEVLLVLASFRSARNLDAVAVARVVQRSPHEAEQLLRRLADDEVGLIEPSKRTSRALYPKYHLRSSTLARLRRALRYAVVDIDEADRKVIEHIKEFGYITNPTLRRMFDLHVFAARDMLNDLRRRSIIQKLGEARGGRGVRYGPGSDFPGGV